MDPKMQLCIHLPNIWFRILTGTGIQLMKSDNLRIRTLNFWFANLKIHIHIPMYIKCLDLDH